MRTGGGWYVASRRAVRKANLTVSEADGGLVVVNQLVSRSTTSLSRPLPSLEARWSNATRVDTAFGACKTRCATSVSNATLPAQVAHRNGVQEAAEMSSRAAVPSIPVHTPVRAAPGLLRCDRAAYTVCTWLNAGLRCLARGVRALVRNTVVGRPSIRIGLFLEGKECRRSVVEPSSTIPQEIGSIRWGAWKRPSHTPRVPRGPQHRRSETPSNSRNTSQQRGVSQRRETTALGDMGLS